MIAIYLSLSAKVGKKKILTKKNMKKIQPRILNEQGAGPNAY